MYFTYVSTHASLKSPSVLCDAAGQNLSSPIYRMLIIEAFSVQLAEPYESTLPVLFPTRSFLGTFRRCLSAIRVFLCPAALEGFPSYIWQFADSSKSEQRSAFICLLFLPNRMSTLIGHVKTFHAIAHLWQCLERPVDWQAMPHIRMSILVPARSLWIFSIIMQMPKEVIDPESNCHDASCPW